MAMNEVVPERYLTPYKTGRAILPPSGRKGMFDSECVDIPFVFQHQNRFYMMYVGYDGHGYQTALAVSDNLLDWESLGVILGKGEPGRFDSVGSAGTWILKEDDLNKPPALRKFRGRYWMVYHAYPRNGYEEGPAEIGLAWTEDENLMDWHRLDEPIFSWKDGDAWERGGLYKACVVENDGVFSMFYNAKNTETRWTEQIGLATSEDLVHWTRHKDNPVVRVTSDSWDSQFVSDPFVVRDGNLWVMYYFGYDLQHAQNGIAFSRNLQEWGKHSCPILRHGHPGDIDDIHAHKASVLMHENVLYHFYCAARKYQPGDPAKNFGVEFRSISVATSSPIGSSPR